MFSENLAQVKSKIQAVLPSGAASPEIVAVAKGRPAEAVLQALECGICDIGENYADELMSKREEVARLTAAENKQRATQNLEPLPEARWHFLGRLQSNKVPRLGASVHLWQTLDRPKVASLLARHQANARALIQVQTSSDPNRSGIATAQVPDLLKHCQDVGVSVEGLMCIAELGGKPEADFRMLQELAAEHNLSVLSMGMTDDFESAVRCGSTMLRLGRVLFD